jgi:hypothetical protein
LPYIPVILNSDNRSLRGMAPLKLCNWYVEPISQDNKKQAMATLLPTPGLTARLDLGNDIQGIWQEDGVRESLLYAVAGSKLYSISPSWVATEIGTLDAGEAEFEGIRDKLFIAVNTRLWEWNGVTLTEVTDPDLPDVGTMISINQRLLLNSDDDDTLTWSNTLNGSAFEALAFTTAEQSPDPVRRILKLSGQAVVFGSTSIEILRAVPSTTLPFQNVTNQAIEETKGILGKYAAAKSGDKAYLIGGDFQPYVIYGMSVTPLSPNFELKEQLTRMSAADRAETTTWAYRDGPHDYFIVRPKGHPAHVYDGATQLWHTRETYGAGFWAPKYHTRAYGHDVVALQDGSKIYTMDRNVYADDGEPVVRTATFRFNSMSREAIGSFCLDATTFDIPESGQGSSPQLLISFSTDARAVPSANRSPVLVDMPPVGNYWKPTIWGLGQMTPSEGMLAHVSVSDPLGVTIHGAWVNEGQVS